MTNLVTGSRGYIGSHLMRRLNGASALYHDDIVHGNSYNADRLFFLSTYGNMAHHKDERMMLKANVQDLLSVLAYFTGWCGFMSSSSVMLPVQTSYSRYKKASEEILIAMCGYNMASCIVRPYSVTGVGEQKEHLIPTLIRSCMEGTPMDFDASPVHDFVDVEDVVDGLIALSEIQATGIHEFGRGMPYSNDDVKELVEEATGKKANIQSHMTLRSYDNPNWYCKNPSPFFMPLKSLENSIEEMVEAYKNDH